MISKILHLNISNTVEYLWILTTVFVPDIASILLYLRDFNL